MRNYRKPYRLKKKKPIYKKPFLWLVILFLLVTLGIVYLFFFFSFFQIKNIQISGNNDVVSKELRNIINNDINKKILFFPTKSIFLVGLTDIKKEILSDFPAIESVRAKKKFPNGLNFEITERIGMAVWCKEEKCFLIDKNGIIFKKDSNNNALAKIKLSIAPEAKFGQEVLKKEELDKILKINSKLKELKISIQEIFLFSEERINVKTPENWEIYFNSQEDTDWQLTKLKMVLEKEIPLEKRGNLEYIELRFGNLASYKYRENQTTD